MLEGLLVYRHKKRLSAGEMLQHEFVQFHQTAFTVEQIALEAQAETEDAALKDSGALRPQRRKTHSVSLKGSVGRHSLFLDYQKFERSLTALLATLLDRSELIALVKARNDQVEETNDPGIGESDGATNEQPVLAPHEKALGVLPIHTLRHVLEDLKQEQV